ncbi:hypothetical protein AFI02nite_32340 [Aliivibrio fischeri]|uniref:Uncharacterized protein n=1 Tax=Aliivibrio fischeri TaxID=668 RepID=A0A510UKN3_ALIFS|nr:hypothetical protein AFI02nite_32340 [Aliivibrio fischeri]
MRCEMNNTTKISENERLVKGASMGKALLTPREIEKYAPRIRETARKTVEACERGKLRTQARSRRV